MVNPPLTTPNIASKLLREFLSLLPIESRSTVSTTLTLIKSSFDEVIPNTNDIDEHIEHVSGLRLIFSRLPLHLRKRLKDILIDAIASSNSSKSTVTAIFTTCLCILEFCAVRNCDRSDIESEDIWNTVIALKDKVIPVLSLKVKSQRTNLPSLLSWSLCMLIFIFRACLEWIHHQGCEPAQSFSFCDVIECEKSVLEHPSVPVLMRILLHAQSKQRAFLIPPPPYTLFDILFAGSVSSLTDLLNESKPAVKHDNAVSILEQYEPLVSISKNCVNEPAHKFITSTSQELPPELAEILQSGSPEKVLSNLEVFYRLLMEKGDTNNSLRQSLLLVLKNSSAVLFRVKRQVFDDGKCPKKAHMYEGIYTLFLQCWYHATKSRMLLTDLPQSYIWLIGFSQPNYELMSMKGFMEALIWTGRFLTIYQTLFRSLITSSPHWYLQIITDGVVAIIDRAEEVRGSLTSEESEVALHTCVLAISRPFCALRIEDSDFKEEMSRAIKVPLECILSRMARCRTVIPKELPVKRRKVINSTETIMHSAISPQLRQLIVKHLLMPMIKGSDVWALAQARISLRPAAARVILKQLLENTELDRENIPIGHKYDFITPPPAIGGLHVVEKMSKRKH